MSRSGVYEVCHGDAPATRDGVKVSAFARAVVRQQWSATSQKWCVQSARSRIIGIGTPIAHRITDRIGLASLASVDFFALSNVRNA
jgi:hypothetical protein